MKSGNSGHISSYFAFVRFMFISGSKLRIRPRCLELFFLIFQFSRFQLASLSLVHSLSRFFSLFLPLLSVALYKNSNCRARRMLYKMKIIAVGRIIYKEYISFLSNDIILSISDYFARNKKYINMMLKKLLYFVFEKTKFIA